MIDGIDAATYSSTTLNAYALTATIGTVMTGVPSSAVINLQVTHYLCYVEFVIVLSEVSNLVLLLNVIWYCSLHIDLVFFVNKYSSFLRNCINRSVTLALRAEEDWAI